MGNFDLQTGYVLNPQVFKAALLVIIRSHSYHKNKRWGLASSPTGCHVRLYDIAKARYAKGSVCMTTFPIWRAPIRILGVWSHSTPYPGRVCQLASTFR